MRYIRSPLFYVGDKYKILPQIKQHFPKKINKFIEPFTGGGSVFLNIDAHQYCLNDIDNNVYNIHIKLKDYSNNKDMLFNELENRIVNNGLSFSYKSDEIPKELKEQYKKTYYAKYNKESYQKLKEKFNNSNEKDYLNLYILLIYGFNRMLRFNKNNQFNLPVGNVDYNKNVHSSLESYIDFVKNKNIIWHNNDYNEFLDRISFNNDDFVYLDPPYLISNSEYNKLWNEENEKQLLNKLDELNERNIKFAISNVVEYRGSKNEIFSNWMEKYKVEVIESNYISFNNNQKKEIKEVLVKNYD